MKNSTFTDNNLQLLNRRRDLLRNMVICFTIISLIASILLVYLFATKLVFANSRYILFPIFIFPLTLIPLLTQFRKVNQEIKNRSKEQVNKTQSLNYI